MQVLKLSDVERLAYWDTFAIRQSDPARRFPCFFSHHVLPHYRTISILPMLYM